MIVEVVIAALAARAVGYLVAQSAAFAGLRERITSTEVTAWNRWMAGESWWRWRWLPVAKATEMMQCPVCVGFWAAFAFTWGDGVEVWMAAAAVQLVLAEIEGRVLR